MVDADTLQADNTLGHIAGEISVPVVVFESAMCDCYIRIIRDGQTIAYDVWFPDILMQNPSVDLCKTVLDGVRKVFGDSVISRDMLRPAWETTIRDMIDAAAAAGIGSEVQWANLPSKVRARFPDKGKGPGLDARPSVRAVWPNIWGKFDSAFPQERWTTDVARAIEAQVAEIP